MEYDSIIKTAYEENPLPETPAKKRGRKKKGKVLNLICRLDNYKASVCLFIKNLCVPFDNNQAERDLRMIKIKTKISDASEVKRVHRNILQSWAISDQPASME